MSQCLSLSLRPICKGYNFIGYTLSHNSAWPGREEQKLNEGNVHERFHHELRQDIRSEDSMRGGVSIQTTTEDKHLEEPAKNVPSIHFPIMGRRTEWCWEWTWGKNVAYCYKKQFQEEKDINSAAESREAKKEAGWDLDLTSEITLRK